MAKHTSKNPDAKRAHNIKYRSLTFVKGSLIVIGKPFYLLLSYFFIFLLTVSYLPIKLPKLPKFNRRATLAVITALALGFNFWYVILKDLPSPKELTKRDVPLSTKIYDRNGILLYKIYKSKNRTLVPIDQIPQNIQLATLAAEDAEFYNHLGFSIKGITRAFARNFQRGELTGGSTITQQLVKNTLLSPEKTFTRKVKEIILAIEVEFTYPKSKILEMYLNEVSYGGTAYGVEEAAAQYFGKSVDKLTLAEAALLAGLPKSPTKYSPFGVNPELALERQREVLRLMRINHYITSEEETQALAQKLTFAENRTEIKAPHFVMYVRSSLVDKYGEEMTEEGGLSVITTLDYRIQKLAEEVVANEVKALRGLKVGNGAALVLDPATGEILAMVGSKDYFDTAAGGNVNVTIRSRQPGSSVKVINYAYALSHDYTPASIIDDSPVTFSMAGSEPYSPKNYDGGFLGKITLRSALAQSRNVPAVKVLASYGTDKMAELGRKMGITTWDNPKGYGLSLTLGGTEVKLLDLARAYATIADYGRRPDLSFILKVTNSTGQVLERKECASVKDPKAPGEVFAAEAAGSGCPGEPVLDPRVAFMLIDILKDNTARAPEFGFHSSLVIPNHPEVAVKTGTSNDLKDNLTLGFTQKYLVAAWVGNNDSSPMSRIASGITGAAPIWNKIMSSLLADEVSSGWHVPDGLVQARICSSSPEWFFEGKIPVRNCSPEAASSSALLAPAPHFP